MCSGTTTRFGYLPGDRVEIADGTFQGMRGTVLAVLEPHGQVRLDLSIFCRPVAVELDYHQLRGPLLDEAGYLASCDARRLVSFLRVSPFHWSIRRVALFGCACLRLVWDRLDTKLRGWVVDAEELADNKKSNVRKVTPGHRPDENAWTAWEGILQFQGPLPVCPGQLVHDIFGNPFRPRSTDPRWLGRLDGAVLHLARDIYDTRRWAEMPVLGDALEDAGCADPAILDHCRGPGPHARGCWLLDLVLARE
jgi:hypothetical protein